MDIILYKIAILCLIAQTHCETFPDEGCYRENKLYDNDSGNCVHTIYCRKYVYNIDYSSRRCDNSIYSHFYNSDREPCNIVFKDIGNYDSVPHCSNNNYEPYIYSLDLRNNDYISVPTLTRMNNLAIVKLSMNSLITAKLSNSNDLPALTDLDYSHNNIDKIEVVPGEFQYRKLKKLNISHNALVDIPEAMFDSFDDLEYLDLSHNFIYTLSMLTFEGIRKLLHLYLSNNRITELNSSLLRFNDLVTLDLSHNSIRTLKVIDFNKLANLMFLSLNSNYISHIEKHVFDDMVSLTTVDLRDNIIENIDQEMFANATQLKSVNLSRNKLKLLPNNMFKGRSILNFSIEGNKLEGSLLKGTFEGLTLVTELDLSGQNLKSVENYAFGGVPYLKTLILNNNDIQSLSNYSFKGLQNLYLLDLSHNNIIEIDIITEDLLNLQMLSLHHNKITRISSDNFKALTSLQFLDLSHNNISHFESNSFKSLQSLLDFKISQNPLSGSLEEKTFDGLNSLPSLDVSGSLITQINNCSFMGMALLKDLNISHSNISELQFNSLSYLHSIQTIDLSYNQLSEFKVNTTDLTNIRALILNNNFLQVISPTALTSMSVLSKVILSYNNIRSLSKDLFFRLDYLNYLDLSYNRELQFDVELVEKSQSLSKLFISGVQPDVTFERISDTPLTVLEITHSGIQNITRLNLRRLERLENLFLSNNAVSKLEVGGLSNLTSLKLLDLSFNDLSFIQPGAFKDNVYLNLLNISHNKLMELNYGFFRGLFYLETMDLSYNSIQSLHKGRFYEVEHLKTLIADNNKIDIISQEEFSETQLLTLSIGGNPIPCEILAELKKNSFLRKFSITAIELDDTRNNVDGVTCIKDRYNLHTNKTSASVGHENVLLDIRDILYNVSRGQVVKEHVIKMHEESPYLANISVQQEKLHQNSLDTIEKLSSVSNLTSTLVNVNSNTNLLLGKILRALTSKDSIPLTTGKPIAILKENATSENFMSFVNKIKNDLEETLAVEKQNIIIELDSKLEKLNSRIDSSIWSTKMPVHDKLVVSNDNKQESLMFTEICVGLILVILVSFLLFQLYKSKVYIPRSFSNSSRHIAESMENSNL